MSKISYLFRSIAQLPKASASLCPNCGSHSRRELDSKYFITRLCRCNDCQLMFRSPTDSQDFNRFFYNFKYKQGMTTECPPKSEIETLKTSNFAGSERDFAGYVDFLDRHCVPKGMRLFDFGCSWGYGSFQFARAGYDVYSHEIGVDRRTYAIENLGIRHLDDPYAIIEGHPLFNSFDCFFSSHVLEHVPAPSKVIDLAWQCLKPGGAFVAFTPNGNDAFRRHDPQGWRNMWGGVHPNYLDDVFYDHQFARSRRLYDSRDGGEVNTQYELGFVAFKDANKGGF